MSYSILPGNHFMARISDLASILETIDKVFIADQVSQTLRLEIGLNIISVGLILLAEYLYKFIGLLIS